MMPFSPRGSLPGLRQFVPRQITPRGGWSSMRERRLGRVSWLVVTVAAIAPAARGAVPAPGPVDESYFARTLPPTPPALQCGRCHGDNGVAPEPRVAFPPIGAPEADVTAFGLKLMDL